MHIIDEMLGDTLDDLDQLAEFLIEVVPYYRVSCIFSRTGGKGQT